MQARDAARHPAWPRMVPTMNSGSAPHAHSARAETPSLEDTLGLRQGWKSASVWALQGELLINGRKKRWGSLLGRGVCVCVWY